ncbi:hypothetical protein Glove_13g24 [Diversispora epigaea]|uniref:Uncharacterized protein n=1 Tax=Diversispora epigaea TaxID=1348612 RepID=A0A397JMM0_9GLOM|nr:hypothetical protein Glove_13g24 [Diversispora epigaea]
MSSSIVLPVRHIYDEMILIVASLRESLEECTIQLHYIIIGICYITLRDDGESEELIVDPKLTRQIHKSRISLLSNGSIHEIKFTAQLVDLWDEINGWFLNMNVMNSLRAYKRVNKITSNNNNNKLLFESADEVYELLSQVSHHQELYAEYSKIYQ